MQSSDAQKTAKASEDKAWLDFFSKFLYADKSKFDAQTDFSDGHKATSEIYFKAGGGLQKSIFGSDQKYWPEEMKNALGLGKHGGFPQQLIKNNMKCSTLPIPVISFYETP